MITTNETYVKWLRSDTKLSFADWLNATPYGLHDFTIAKPFTPKVGDKVRSRNWVNDQYVNVEGVGSTGFAGRNEFGIGVMHSIAVNNNPWELWTAPKPQRYEYRAPKAGERYVAFSGGAGEGDVVVGPTSGPSPLRLVLVDE
jgi:hypothetical protein